MAKTEVYPLAGVVPCEGDPAPGYVRYVMVFKTGATLQVVVGLS